MAKTMTECIIMPNNEVQAVTVRKSSVVINLAENVIAGDKIRALEDFLAVNTQTRLTKGTYALSGASFVVLIGKIN
jgi:hypothetical protein